MPTDSPALADADLVTRAQSGDRDALGALYDRYAATVFDLCAHMLRDRDAAADATAEVFLAAAEHIDELQDPTKVKSWLYAIARNEVYRRGRTREAPMAEVPDVTAPVVYRDAVLDEPLAAPDDTAALLREAALGLAERDRLVLELTLAGGLDGRALGDALGVSVDAAHQASHRMRDRLARSVGALLVARQGASECPALRGVLDEWDGSFSVLWRKRVARHVDRCTVCGRRGRSVREKVLAGTFAALPVTLLTPPSWLRDRILGDATLPPDVSGPRRGGRWRRDGFPPVGAVARRRRVLAALLGGVAVVLVVAGAVTLLTEDDGPTTSIVAREQVTTTRANGSAAREAPSSTPGQPGVLAPGTDPTSTTATTKPKIVAPPPPPPPPDTTGPTLKLSGDTDYTFPPCAQPPGNAPLVRADVLDPSGISTVTGTYSGPASGSFTLSPVGGTGWEKRVTVPLVGSYTITVTARDVHGNPTTASRGLTAWNCIG